MTDNTDQIDHNQLWSSFVGPLWEDLKDKPSVWDEEPLLAHYTSLEVLEQILTKEEVWFSNPFYMNDIEELKYGIERGAQYFINSKVIADALGTPERHERFTLALDKLIQNYDQTSLLDTFVFCLSEHERENTDGLLSMWRGYGGNGSGAAIVLDTKDSKETHNSPLIFAKVYYMSAGEREEWFKQTAEVFAKCLGQCHVPDHYIAYVTEALFDRLKMFALFHKHNGFSEEKEWRVVYMPEKDPQDKLKPMISYFNGPNGIEPKLKFHIAPIDGVTSNDLSLMKLFHSIILGPSITGRLSLRAVKRMLKLIGKKELVDHVYESSIPYRPSKSE